MVACCVAECMLLLAYGAVVAAMVPLVAFGSNGLGGEFSQSDSLLTHVLGGIIVAEPCICWESGSDVMFGHLFPPHIRFPMLIF